MEKKIKILGYQQYHETAQKMLTESPEMQRFMFFSNELHAYGFSTRAETEDNIYWGCQSKKPMFENNKLFYKSQNVCGASFDKKSKSLKIWFNQSFTKLIPEIAEDILDYFKLDWYKNMSNALKSLISNGLLNRMIKGKITNPDDFIKAYIKISPFRNLDISPRLFYLTFQDENAPSPRALRRKLEQSTDVNNAMQMLSKGLSASWHFDDLYQQAQMLNRKVNPAWSEKRRHEVHAQWTREIMEIKVKRMKQKEYEYSLIDLPEGVHLISNNYELFEEGSIMKHCIYSNYEYRIENKQYFALRYNYNGVRATVGLKVDSYYDGLTAVPKLVIDQMYGIGNTSVDPEHRIRMEEWINQSEVQYHFMNEVTKHKVSEPAGFL